MCLWVGGWAGVRGARAPLACVRCVVNAVWPLALCLGLAHFFEARGLSLPPPPRRIRTLPPRLAHAPPTTMPPALRRRVAAAAESPAPPPRKAAAAASPKKVAAKAGTPSALARVGRAALLLSLAAAALAVASTAPRWKMAFDHVRAMRAAELASAALPAIDRDAPAPPLPKRKFVEPTGGPAPADPANPTEAEIKAALGELGREALPNVPSGASGYVTATEWEEGEAAGEDVFRPRLRAAVAGAFVADAATVGVHGCVWEGEHESGGGGAGRTGWSDACARSSDRRTGGSLSRRRSHLPPPPPFFFSPHGQSPRRPGGRGGGRGRGRDLPNPGLPVPARHALPRGGRLLLAARLPGPAPAAVHDGQERPGRRALR